jgi:DNA-binding transcriptional MerR regulator
MAVEKREGAFLTIGEVALKLDLPQHVLRFWETRFEEFEPLKRAGGRRYYRPRDVALAAALRALLYGQGYTIKGVQRLLRERGVNAVIESARLGALPPPSEAEPAEPAVAPASERAAAPPVDAPAPAADKPALPVMLPAVIAPEPSFAGGLGDEEIRALRLALADLAEARRLLLLSKG